jgi:hypothetical protein
VLVRDVDHPARQQAFGTRKTCLLPAGETTCFSFETAPAGKRLVIDALDVWTRVPPGQKAWATFQMQVGGENHGLSLPLTPQGPSFGDESQDVFVAFFPVRLYADVGSIILMGVTRNSPSGSGSFTGHIVGHLIDCGVGEGCPTP